MKKLPHGTLETAYQTIEKKLKEVNDYVQIWFQYQSLWDMEPATVYARLGNDLNAWQRVSGIHNLLTDFRYFIIIIIIIF